MKLRRSWRVWTLLLVVLAAAGAAIFAFSSDDVVVVKPAYGPAVQAIYATGRVEPSIMMPIAPRIGARLVELDVDEGSQVRKGQVLARLESEDVIGNLRQLEAQERFALRNYNRYSAMLKEGIVAREAYDRAKADWEAAVAATARAKAEASFMTLTALDGGLVIRRDGEIGELIAANQPIFWLAGRSATRISADVDEEDIARIRVGQRVLIRADAFPGRVFDGSVLAITPKGDNVARSFRVRISVRPDAPLMIGMTTETNILVRQVERALLVPTSAITAGKAWTAENGRLASRAVSVGVSRNGKSEILSGLTDRDLVVVNPDPERTGEKVHIVMGHFAP